MINQEFCKDTSKAIRKLIEYTENWLLKMFTSEEELCCFITIGFVYSRFVFWVCFSVSWENRLLTEKKKIEIIRISIK